MRKLSALALLGGVSLAFAAPTGAMAQNIDTTGGGTLTDYWQPFGSPDTATYGQTFTAGAGQNMLQSFSLFLGNRASGSGPLSLKGYLGTWTGSALGTLLYSSDVRSTTGNEELLFNTGGTGLSLGTQYVAFLSVSDFGTQAASTFYMPQANAPLANENFVYNNNGTDFAALTSTSWAVVSPQVAFKATFGAGNGAVPEPATWALMLVGFTAVGGAMRSQRRRQAVTVRYA